MKAKNMLLALVALFALSTPILAQPVKELPWFLKNIAEVSAPADQWKEFFRDMNASWVCFQGNPHGMDLLVPGDDSYRYPTDIVSTSSVSKKPFKLTVVLDHHVEITSGPDKGKFAVTTLCGEKKILTRHEVEVVRDYMIEQVMKPSVKADSEFWGPVLHNAIQLGVESRVGKEKAPEMLKHLDENMPGYDITRREYWGLPRENKDSDFVPVELHLGYNLRLDGIFGVAQLNIGLVYLNPQALQIDFMQGGPSVTKHEFVHANSNVENFPLSGAYDPELLATVPGWFATNDQISFFFHGYMSLPRKLAKVFFSYDVEQIRKQCVRFDDGTGNWFINEKCWNDNVLKGEAVKKEFLSLLLPKALEEFYANQEFWFAMNDKRKDNNAVFRMMMAKYYDSTSLGGRVPTVQWREAHKDEIVRIARKALEDLESDDDSNSMSDMAIPPYLTELYRKTFTISERIRLESYFRAHPAELKRLLRNPSELLKFAFTLTNKQSTGGVR